MEVPMYTAALSKTIALLFSELTNGAPDGGGAFMLNSGDEGMLRALDRLDAGAASRNVADGASVAAHAQHVRYGLTLMNRWAREGGNPFADARWDEAWTISTVTEPEWAEIRRGLRDEATQWAQTLATPKEVADIELAGMVGSVAHLAYHLGAIRQIAAAARGPREGTFSD
jgi:hypothetical protein